MYGLPTVFLGMTTPQLQAALTAAQTAYVELMAGGRGVSFSYTQGDGTKSVAYQKTDAASLKMFIGQLQAALGLIDPRQVRRRPMRPIF